jgi:hypothetical protein
MDDSIIEFISQGGVCRAAPGYTAYNGKGVQKKLKKKSQNIILIPLNDQQ